MRVAILTSSLDATNGWGRYTMSLVRAMRDEGVQCDVFTEDVARPADFGRIYMLRSRPGSGVRGIFRLAIDIIRFRRHSRLYDAVHACTETHIFLAWLSGKPFVVSTHGTYMVRFLKHRFVGRIAARALAKARKVIVTSEHTYEQMRPYVHIQRTEQLPNGVDTRLFRRNHHIVRQPHTYITVGAIKPRKGQDVGIRALALLRDRFPDSRYVIVGRAEFGEFRKYLDALIAEYGLESRVIFAGSPDDTTLVGLYNKSGVFVLPSRIDDSGSFEGYPLSLLEASACGLPIIGSYGCGAEHLIENGKNGFLVSPDDVEGLAEALSKLFEDSAGARHMGERAVSIAENLSWKRNALRVIDIYREIISKSRNHRP